MMSGYEKSGFGDEPEPGSFVKAFDAFPKSKPQYVTHTSGGGKWTVTMIFVSLVLLWFELGRWWQGSENHTFAVEKGVGHDMQINLDIVLRMKCADLHVNVQDAAGDRILAASKLQEDPTNWSQWVDNKGMHKLGRDSHGKAVTGAGWHDEGFGEEHVHDIVALGKKRARWGKTPRIWGRGGGDSCRIYGSLDLNKVQGDFHITAIGHGYTWMGDHLDHTAFNFSHITNEFSFGPFYPSLVNPLDRTVNIATNNFHKFQYFMSVVPTVYTVGHAQNSRQTIFTNQYAVTEQSHEVNERMVPGIFFKYDIEPIMLTIEENRDGYLTFLIKIINVLSGVLVAGHWGFTLSDWVKEVVGKRRRQQSQGMIGVGKKGYED
ncbi:endoplasmic reticulum vesicle transporter-domain-containing protein [Pseudomassariella vexata]|uniref:Endoplasmic reticulum-Golgi intermediate compartment protein n=1 Tax=Pseudomassariella vexata TaxID=1141098 RepID=A0A1Y2DDT8_9PEZI|nr:endoplasmic reticulum vesicle transporter-domain-containing protein [Pseudomassariella vexata]ORY57286.1 endoplasmic reticulum vesicle transporter-domain-containing protein [Pseudomassariella vexata]